MNKNFPIPEGAMELMKQRMQMPKPTAADVSRVFEELAAEEKRKEGCIIIDDEWDADHLYDAFRNGTLSIDDLKALVRMESEECR